MTANAMGRTSSCTRPSLRRSWWITAGNTLPENGLVRRLWNCSQSVKRRDGYFLVPVRDVGRTPYAGYVYNIETAGDPHTYLVKGFAVHNCTAPMRDENQLHAAVVELIALDDGEVKYSTIQNWYPGDKEGKGGIYNFVTKRGKALGRNSKISWTQVETGSAITWKYPS